MIKKILVFLKSWHLLDEGQHYSCIVCGPDDFYQRNFFKNDYIFADILNSNPIVLRYFFLSLKIFFKNLFKIKFTLSNCRYLFLVSSLTPYIYKKKIKSIICFIDYYKIGKIFKLVLGNDINLIGFQFSVRGKPSLRYNLINNYDFYYLWDEMEKKLDTYQNNKIIKFGSLKSCAALEINKKWEVINHEYRKSNKILLISSIAENYEFFFTKYLSKKNTNIEEKLKSLIKKFDKKDFKLMREQQAFDFFRLCILLKKYLVKTKKPLEIILRGTKKNFNR